jgi:hypothetical protein
MQHPVRASALLAVVALLWALGPAPVHADENQGFSIGGGVGRYNLKIDSAHDLGTAINNYSTTDTAYQFFAKYRFAPFLAIEGQYMNLGTGTSFAGPGTELRTHISGWTPWLVATIPLGPTNSPVIGPFEIFGKVGQYFYQYHRDYITSSGNVYLTHSNTYNHFVWGVGVGLVFIKHLDVRLEYDMLNIQNSNTSNALWLTAAFNL